MNNDFAKHQQRVVHNFYETHGASFAETRKNPWPEQILIAKEITPEMTVLDIGAGNGRFASILPEGVNYIGIEPSKRLREAAPAGVRLKPGELPELKLDNELADITVCFAVLHHIPTEALRERAVKELIRITKPGGMLVASAWRINTDEVEPVAHSKEDDVWIPWKADQKTAKRFVHRFTLREWKKLWTRPGLEIEKIGLFGKDDWTEDQQKARNFFVIAKKKSA